MCKKNLENCTPHLRVVKGKESGWKHGSPCGRVMAEQGHESELVGNPGSALGFCSHDYLFQFQPLGIVGKLQLCSFS